MKTENAIRILAGTMILLSLALTRFVHPDWIWLTVFDGINLIQAAFTGICPAESILLRLGLTHDKAACGKAES